MPKALLSNYDEDRLTRVLNEKQRIIGVSDGFIFGGGELESFPW